MTSGLNASAKDIDSGRPAQAELGRIFLRSKVSFLHIKGP